MENKNNDYFKMLFEQAPLGYQSLDFDGNFIEINQKWLDTFGYERNEVIGKWFGDFLTPPYQDGFRERFPVFKAQGHIHSEFEMLHKNGDILFIAFEGKIGNDTEGNFKQTHCILEDITDKKKNEKKLEYALDLLKNAAKIAKFGGWNVILSEDRSYWSDEVAAIHEMPAGYAPLLNEGINFYAPEWREKITQVFTDCAQKGIPYDEEMEILTSTGKRVWVRTNGEAVRDDKGMIYKVQGGFQDITERKQAEEALVEIEWMLSEKKVNNDNTAPEYGDLSSLNKNGLILSSVGKEQLVQIASEYLDLMETSSAIYEKNGDYALGLFSSSWCQLMDSASRKLCRTDNNKEALDCGKWLCHESCWQDASKKAIESGKPADVECSGGIRLYAVPIYANGKVVGVINFGYGEPPKDDVELQKLSDLYQVTVEQLREKSLEYQIRPQYIIDYAKKRIQVSARQIGDFIDRKQAENELRESEERFKALHNASFGGIAIHDKGLILECNLGLSKMTGYSLDELIGMDGLLLIAPGSRELVLSNIMAGSEKAYEGLGLRKNGEIYPMMLEARNIHYKGKSVRTVEFRDITESKKAEETIKQRIDELENFQRLVVGRELKMTELKQEINELLKKLGQEPKY